MCVGRAARGEVSASGVSGRRSESFNLCAEDLAEEGGKAHAISTSVHLFTCIISTHSTFGQSVL